MTLAQAISASFRQGRRATNEDAFLMLPGRPLVVGLADDAGNAEQAERHALRLLERSLDVAAEPALQGFPAWSAWSRSIDTAMLGGSQTTLIAVGASEETKANRPL